MFRNKEVVVKLADEADKVYTELNKMVGEEKLKGIKSSFHQTLLRSINRVKEELKQNPFAGDQIPKKQLPEKKVHLGGTPVIQSIHRQCDEKCQDDRNSSAAGNDRAMNVTSAGLPYESETGENTHRPPCEND